MSIMSYIEIQCIDFHHETNLNSKHARLWVSMVHRAFIEINQTTNQIHLLGRAAMPACLYRSFLFYTTRYTGYTCCCNVVVVR